MNRLRRSIAGLLLAVAGLCSTHAAAQASQPFENGTLPRRWVSAGPDCATFTDDFQVHAYSPDFYILRQTGCVNAEKPFLYLLVGQERAILFDTGAGSDTDSSTGRVPNVVAAVDRVMGEWLKRNQRQSLPLVVAHLHSHADHVWGDFQFAGRPTTTLVKPDDVGALQRFFSIARWPVDIGTYDLGGRVLDIIPVPGHDATSIAVYDRQTAVLLTGDVVYPGRLYVNEPDPQVMQDSLQRLVDFTQKRPVAHVLGSHIEQRGPYSDYPRGQHHAPQEAQLQLGRAHLLEVLQATRLRTGSQITQKAYRDFTLCGAYPTCEPGKAAASGL